jgi:putative MATE family efflux protein
LQQENKMGTMSINKLLITMSVPMMLSMLVQALYNVVDSMFVAMISENALTAVSLAYPFQNLMIAVGVGTGVGVNSLLSRSLGEKRYDQVKSSACNGILLAGLSYLVFAVIGMTCSRLFFEVQTTNTEIIEYGYQYIWICCMFSFGMFFQTTLEKILTATGKTMLAMTCQLVGALVNIVFDPIFIFGLFGLPAFGVAGAAIATVAGQIISCALGLFFNLKMNPEARLNMKGFRPNMLTISRIYAVGLPSIVMQSIGSVMTFGLNLILMGISSTAAAVLGVYFKLQSFIFMPVFGLNNGMTPIVGYNYGARKPERIVKCVKLAVVYAVSIMIIGILLFQLIPDKLLAIFSASDHMISIGVPALRIISTHFIFAGISVVANSCFQALGHGVYSLINSLMRQLVVLLPVAWLFSLTGNVDLVWLAFPIAELISVTVACLFLRHIYKKEILPLYDNQEVSELSIA